MNLLNFMYKITIVWSKIDSHKHVHNNCKNITIILREEGGRGMQSLDMSLQIWNNIAAGQGSLDKTKP